MRLRARSGCQADENEPGRELAPLAAPRAHFRSPNLVTLQWPCVVHVAPRLWHQQSASRAQRPGSPLTARTQILAELQTSPPHTLPDSMQSVSLLHVLSPPSSWPCTPPALAVTLPPPARLRMRPTLLDESSVNHRLSCGPTVMS